MTIRQKLRDFYDDMAPKLECAGAITAAYLGLTLAVNAVAIPVVAGFNGIERLVGAKENTYEARLVNKGTIKLHNGGYLLFGDFVSPKADTVRLYDNSDIFEGKIFANTRLDKAQIDKNYRIKSLEGPISNKILNLSEAQR